MADNDLAPAKQTLYIYTTTCSSFTISIAKEFQTCCTYTYSLCTDQFVPHLLCALTGVIAICWCVDTLPSQSVTEILIALTMESVIETPRGGFSFELCKRLSKIYKYHIIL